MEILKRKELILGLVYKYGRCCSRGSGRTRYYYDLYQELEYLESSIRPELLYNEVMVAVLHDRLASLSNQDL